MKPNQFLGLIKFYRDEEFLDKLISGCFHCTPPERYRLSNQTGVSDKHESCVIAYRKERNDSPVALTIGGHKIEDALSVTVHMGNYNGGGPDAWMHCWFSLRVPSTEDDLMALKSDIAQMKSEFGQHCAFIPFTKLKLLTTKLQELSEKKMYCGEVAYSDIKGQWNTLCKSTEYSYQREYRFLFGECSTSELEYYIFNNSNGFEEYIYKNPDLKLVGGDDKTVYIDLKDI